MKLTSDLLYQFARRANKEIIENIVAYQSLFDEYDITPGLRRAHLFAQLAHESDGFRTTREYASGRAYEGRADLGNTQPGDGVRYKGRGLIQLTGRANYQAYSVLFPDDDIVETPELVEQFPYALEVSLAYWKNRNLNKFADADDIRTITRRINGGLNGFADRQAWLIRAKGLGL